MQLDALVSLKCCITTLGSWEALLAERAVSEPTAVEASQQELRGTFYLAVKSQACG